MAGSIPFGCGQCLPCRVNRRRQWMWRQYLESLCHDDNCFVTLTYDDINLPDGGVLVPAHLTEFIREFRRVLYPRRIRYYAVGEYGEENLRPHYHLSVFGVSPFSVSHIGGMADTVRVIWKKGFVSVYEFNHLTAQYVAGYVVKKLTDRKNDIHWVVPEFARMSNRPGIGARAMETIARQLLNNYQGWADGDVPRQLHIGKRTIPFGRYLLARLRKEVGFTPEYIKEIRDRATYQQSIQMQSLLEGLAGGSTIKAEYLKDLEGKMDSVEAKAKLLRKRSGK